MALLYLQMGLTKRHLPVCSDFDWQAPSNSCQWIFAQGHGRKVAGKGVTAKRFHTLCPRTCLYTGHLLQRSTGKMKPASTCSQRTESSANLGGGNRYAAGHGWRHSLWAHTHKHTHPPMWAWWKYVTAPGQRKQEQKEYEICTTKRTEPAEKKRLVCAVA